MDGALVAKRLVGPFSHGSDFLDGSDTVVGNQDLVCVSGEVFEGYGAPGTSCVVSRGSQRLAQTRFEGGSLYSRL